MELIHHIANATFQVKIKYRLKTSASKKNFRIFKEQTPREERHFTKPLTAFAMHL
jgi:hypothetical protein